MCVYLRNYVYAYVRIFARRSPIPKTTQAHTYTSKCACVLNSCLLRRQDGGSNSATANQTNLQAALAISGIRK